MMKCRLAASARTAAADSVTSRPNHGLRCVTAVLAVAAWVWLAWSPADAQTPGAAAVGVKIEQMLKATGFTYKTHNPITWSIEFERKTIGKFRVIISNSEDIIVTFATVTEKAKIRKTPQLMEALLSANHEYDYAKIGLDKDGDLFVRIDSPVRVTDSALLKYRIRGDPNARAAHPREDPGAEVRREQDSGNRERGRGERGDPAGELGSDLRNHAPASIPSPSLARKQAGRHAPCVFGR